MGGAFLQTPTASALRSLLQSKDDMDEGDRQEVMSFLDSTQSSDYSPQSGQITGILKQSEQEMSAALADATKAENAAIASFAEVMSAKKKEIAACTAAIEKKTVRVGETALSIAQMKNELTDSEEALIEDKKFLADMEKNCKTKQAEWDEIVKVRAEEQVALAETIKILNDDDALEMFKKTLPGAASSFLEMSSAASAKARALDFLKGFRNPNIDFIALALHGKKIGFEKVIKMVDDMVALLKQEQADDDNKKEYCTIQLDSLEDKQKGLELAVSDAEKAIADAKESIATLAGEIEALTKGIKALDKNVAEASEQRKKENADFTELMAQDTAAKELLDLAKNRLNKFYNPKLYVAPDLAQIRVHGAPPPPPEAPGAYSKKSEEANGVIAMLDQLVRELEQEMTEAEAEEKNSQADYETAMKDAAEKRAADSKSVTEKKGAKADTEAALEQHTGDKKSASEELAATGQAIGALHGECDWLLKYFDVRKEARSSEIDALGKAKAVLSGADFSLVQTNSRRLRGAPKMEIVGKDKNYRNAWDDCGGVGASATMRMQTIAAKIKGWSKPRKFIRNAAQDAGAVDPSGTKPGPAAALVYPAAGTWTVAREGLAKAKDTLAKYK